jgi:glycosyltransferase involved in cell wall biosynthesis
VIAFPASLAGRAPEGARVSPTLARGKARLPYRLLGSIRTFALHDRIVSHRMENHAADVDIVHAWPLGATRTLTTAKRIGIPAVIERPNAYTRFALEVVKKECERLGVAMPPGHEHAEDPEKVRIEEEEYQLADRLLCPSDFVARTFREQGFPAEKLARHQYGFDDTIFFPDNTPRETKRGLTMLFAGGCAPRKGLHYALQAWLESPAHRDGQFLIAGEFIPGYGEKLASLLSHSSIHVLGHRSDIPELMRRSDILVLPTIEEGSALVTSEARGSGCVLLVSEAAGAVCKHMENALVHPVGDVDSLTQHLTMLHEDRNLLATLRSNSLRTTQEITWAAAGRRLLDVYRETIRMFHREKSAVEPVASH